MTYEIAVRPAIPAMTSAAIDAVRQIENERLQLPQIAMETQHQIHGGIYSRTIFIPAGVMITGVLVKVPTTLILQGQAVVFVGDQVVRFVGYNVLAASARRKQAFAAEADTYLTMMFPTTATTVEEAEQEFTDESDLLWSRRSSNGNHILITGE